jgi:hypothetical protein
MDSQNGDGGDTHVATRSGAPRTFVRTSEVLNLKRRRLV